jgi:hypothetical protein
MRHHRAFDKTARQMDALDATRSNLEHGEPPRPQAKESVVVTAGSVRRLAGKQER